MKHHRATLTILIMMTVAGLVAWSMFAQDHEETDAVNVHSFPTTIGAWQSEEIPISESDYAILETRNAFVRVYRNPQGEEVMLYIIYSQTNRRVAHPPEICYSGGGATIISKFPEKITDAPRPVTANRLLIDYPSYQQVMYYWFKIGTTFTPSYWMSQGLIAYKNLTRQPSSSALIRLTSTVAGDNPDASARVIRDFARELLPVLPEFLP